MGLSLCSSAGRSQSFDIPVPLTVGTVDLPARTLRRRKGESRDGAQWNLGFSSEIHTSYTFIHSALYPPLLDTDRQHASLLLRVSYFSKHQGTLGSTAVLTLYCVLNPRANSTPALSCKAQSPLSLRVGPLRLFTLYHVLAHLIYARY